MSDSTADDAGLRATEAQMRHALGLHGDVSPQSSNSESHPQRRRFVRDGEVPVTLVHRDQRRDGEPGSSQQDAIRQAIRSQVAARERAERSLELVQAAIRDLRTKLAHERLAKDEAVRRAEGETQTIQQALQALQDALATERAARHQAEQERDEVIIAYQEDEERLRVIMATQETETPASVAPQAKSGKMAFLSKEIPSETPSTTMPATQAGDGEVTPKQPRRRGRPPKVGQPESEFVEWWKPGWRDRFG